MEEWRTHNDIGILMKAKRRKDAPRGLGRSLEERGGSLAVSGVYEEEEEEEEEEREVGVAEPLAI